jgi:hypothetical protein
MGELWGRIEFTADGFALARGFAHFSPCITIGRMEVGYMGPELISVSMSNDAYPFAGDVSLMVGGE